MVGNQGEKAGVGMNVALALRNALSGLSLPVYQNEYTGENPVYFVFNISTVPDDFADDNPQHERAVVQLHLFCPISQNTTELRGQVKRALVDAEFDYPSLTDATDEDGQHVVFGTGCAYGAF